MIFSFTFQGPSRAPLETIKVESLIIKLLSSSSFLSNAETETAISFLKLLPLPLILPLFLSKKNYYLNPLLDQNSTFRKRGIDNLIRNLNPRESERTRDGARLSIRGLVSRTENSRRDRSGRVA